MNLTLDLDLAPVPVRKRFFILVYCHPDGWPTVLFESLSPGQEMELLMARAHCAKFKEVDASSIVLESAPFLDAFVYFNEKRARWDVVEGQSGSGWTGDTEEEAIAIANEFCSRVGPDRVKEFVDRAIKMRGESPDFATSPRFAPANSDKELKKR
jgi:hypothetical protein